ncbi:hypothetical protein MMC22_008241 [Lobaria immixta]|nr:hypothetical protein [Lobaria immixta]
MSSCVADLDGILQSMLLLKAPGVTGSKIGSITTLCNANIQSETVLIQKIYTHFKKAPGTHKLGVLYVVDSVTRQWVDQARKAGQPSGSAVSDGTFAAGVNHVTELLPSFMTDIINTAPEDQKARIKKLVDIWERGNTFPLPMLSSFKEKLNAPNSNAVKSTTPDGTPPKDFIPLNEQAGSTAPTMTDTSRILQTLREMAQTNTAASGLPSQASSNNVTSSQNAFAPNMSSSVNPALSVPPVSQAVSVPGAANGVLSFAGLSNTTPTPNFPHAQNVPNGQSNMQSAPMLPPSGGPTSEALQQQLQILQALQAQGVPQDQWATVLSVLISTSGAAAAPNTNFQAQPNWQQNNGGYAGTGAGAGVGAVAGGRDDPSRDRNGFNDQYVRSPSGRHRNPRSRSRSPPGWDRRRDASPPRRRDSPVYGEYDGDPSGRNSGRGSHGRQGRGRGAGNDYRQRSPPPDRFRRSASPRHHEVSLPTPGPKWVEYDRSLSEGTIKVLSRTLFVGGVTSSEDVLRGIFSAFGLVQTCIVNVEKRHAFVKMLTRAEAMIAKEGMERYKSSEMQLRTRWGVGFGPRDCSDYQTGISIIPIDRLTDADRKWMLTAEYGGSGGKPIETGLVVEEPDIEIGAGVSSKAISRRMATDKGGQQGPRSTRDPPSSSTPVSRYRQQERSDRDANSIGVSPAVPGFGFQFPGLPNGMPFIPPGFVMPGTTPAQPPPPGAT